MVTSRLLFSTLVYSFGGIEIFKSSNFSTILRLTAFILIFIISCNSAHTLVYKFPCIKADLIVDRTLTKTGVRRKTWSNIINPAISKPRIALLIHPNDNFESGSFLMRHIAECWRTDGMVVKVLRGIEHFEPADVPWSFIPI